MNNDINHNHSQAPGQPAPNPNETPEASQPAQQGPATTAGYTGEAPSSSYSAQPQPPRYPYGAPYYSSNGPIYGSRPQGTPYPPQSPYSTPRPSYPYPNAGGDYARPVPPRPAEKRGASKGFVITVMCLTLAFSFLLGCLGGALFSSGDAPTIPNIPEGNSVIVQYEPKDESTPVIEDKGSAAYVASVASDTVVEVRTETVVNNSIFGQYVTEGAGSGVIFAQEDNNGATYVITCAHVIEGAKNVYVKLKDGTEYTADAIACDAQTDIGIIKLNVTGLPMATVANFGQVVVGESVVAIGNPLGELGGSVTNGIVSALDRSVIIEGNTYNLLQTNAEINPGNSGGGLFNMEGKLIGIVNAKSAGENIEGIGFAIPIDDAMSVAEELIKNGYVSGRVKLGFMLYEALTDDQILRFRQEYRIAITTPGIYIVESESKDFKLGDRLMALDDITVDSLVDLKSMLLEYEVGETVTVTISRLNANNRAEIMDIDLVLTEKTS